MPGGLVVLLGRDDLVAPIAQGRTRRVSDGVVLDVADQGARADRVAEVAGRVVAVGDRLGGQAAPGRQGRAGQRAEDRFVGVAGDVRRCEGGACGGRDGDLGAERAVGGVVTGDLLGVGVTGGSMDVAGRGDGLALGVGEGVVRPTRELVGRYCRAGVHPGLAAEDVVGVGERVAGGVGGVVDTGLDVVEGLAGPGVGVAHRDLAAALVVLVAPGVARCVLVGGGLACRCVGVGGDVRVGGLTRCGGAVVLPEGCGVASRVGVGAGGEASVRRNAVGAVRAGVGGGTGPLGLGVRHERAADDPAAAVVGDPGLRGHLGVLGNEDGGVGEGGGLVVRRRCLDGPAVRVVDGVGDQAAGSAGVTGALGLTQASETVVEVVLVGVGVVRVEPLRGDDGRRFDPVDAVGELLARAEVGGPARGPDGCQTAESVVLLRRGPGVGVGARQREAATRVERHCGGPVLAHRTGGLGRAGKLSGNREEVVLGGCGIGVRRGQLLAVRIEGGAVRAACALRAPVDVERGAARGGEDLLPVAVVVVQDLRAGGLGQLVGLAEGLVVEERPAVGDGVRSRGRRPAGPCYGCLLLEQAEEHGIAAGGVGAGGADFGGGGGAVALVVDRLDPVGVRGVGGGDGRSGAPGFVRQLRLDGCGRLLGREAGDEVGHTAGLNVGGRRSLSAGAVPGHHGDLAVCSVVGLAGQRGACKPVAVLHGAAERTGHADAAGGLAVRQDVAVHAAQVGDAGPCLRGLAGVGAAGGGVHIGIAAEVVPGTGLGVGELRIVAVPGGLGTVGVVGGLDHGGAGDRVLFGHLGDQVLLEPVMDRIGRGLAGEVPLDRHAGQLVVVLGGRHLLVQA